MTLGTIDLWYWRETFAWW